MQANWGLALLLLFLLHCSNWWWWAVWSWVGPIRWLYIWHLEGIFHWTKWPDKKLVCKQRLRPVGTKVWLSAALLSWRGSNNFIRPHTAPLLLTFNQSPSNITSLCTSHTFSSSSFSSYARVQRKSLQTNKQVGNLPWATASSKFCDLLKWTLLLQWTLHLLQLIFKALHCSACVLLPPLSHRRPIIHC